MPIKPALRRYNTAVIVLSILYALLLIAAIGIFRHHPLTGPLAYVVGVLPALPIVGIFTAIARYITEESDEYIRMVTIRQALIASGFALTVATIWGFLESFDLVRHVDAYYIAVVWFGGQGLGACVNGILARRAA